MSEYAIWTPKHSGHAPPFWKSGMSATYNVGNTAWGTICPDWNEGVNYHVPPEAVNAPFDAAAWLEQGRANLDKLPDGVVLPEPADPINEAILALHRFYEDKGIFFAPSQFKSACRKHFAGLTFPREQSNG